MGVTLYVDEAQYWTWAQHLDWGYFSKPPGVAALIVLSTALFGDGLLGVKALAMLCYPLAAAACWAIARRLYDARVAFWSALAVLTLPIFAWLGLFVSTDALLTLFWALALWAYLRALDSDTWGDWLLLGVVCGLGLLSKYTMAAWLGAAFLHPAGIPPSPPRFAQTLAGRRTGTGHPEPQPLVECHPRFPDPETHGRHHGEPESRRRPQGARRILGGAMGSLRAGAGQRLFHPAPSRSGKAGATSGRASCCGSRCRCGRSFRRRRSRAPPTPTGRRRPLRRPPLPSSPGCCSAEAAPADRSASRSTSP